MITDLKPYAEYKESGSKWLGAVPATWEVRNLRTLISKRAERDRADLPLLSVAREKDGKAHPRCLRAEGRC